MKFENHKGQLRLNKFLTRWIPVLEERSKPAVRARLWINYVLEVLLFVAVAVKRYARVGPSTPYLQLVVLVVRAGLALAGIGWYRLNIQLCSKVAALLFVFCQQDPSMIGVSVAAFVLQIPASWAFAYSGQQRRGTFDQRLSLGTVFAKQLLAYKCVMLCLNYDDATACYLLLLLCLFHLALSCLDQLYNFSIKKVLIGLSLFSTIACATLVLLIQFPDIQQASLIIASCSAFLVFMVWLFNYRQFDSFKILQHNPNSFAEWEYEEYFNKFTYLLNHRKVKENDQLLRGFYNFHLTRCSTPECPITYSHELDKSQRFKTQHQSETYDEFEAKISFVEKYLCNQMEIASIKFPSLKQLYIFFTSPSIDALRYCDKRTFVEYRESVRIEKSLQDKHIEFNTEKIKAVREEIKDKMEIYLDLSNSLWRLLYDDNVDLRRLEKLGSSILEMQEEVRQYESSLFLDGKSTRLINDFKKIILDEKVEHNPIEQQKNQLAFDEIHTRQAPIIVISAEPETLQRIESANAACCRLLGYSKTELLEKNLSSVLPDFVCTAHIKLLGQRSREILYAQEKNLKTLVYIVTSSGYMVESKLSILQLNSITGRKWSCTFEPTNTRNCVLVLDQNNVVQGLTSNGLLMRMNLHTIGKEISSEIMEKLQKFPGNAVPTQHHLDNLIEQRDDEYQNVLPMTTNIRLKDSLMLEDVRIKIVELEVILKTGDIKEEKDVIEYEKEFFTFNFPDLISNVDYHTPIDIHIPQQEHYQFINFGEGINEMRYLDGKIQFKEDKSECSFEKEKTQSSLVEIIDFNMKKETYLEALELSKKNLPGPIFQLNLLILLAVVALTAIAVANFVMFSLATKGHTTNVYVLSQVHQWLYDFYEIASEAVEIGLVNSGLIPNTTVNAFANMTKQLNSIGELSKSLTQNESQLNQMIINQFIPGSPTSLYDTIAQFKLYSNTILNNQTAGFAFASDSPIANMQDITVNYIVPGFQAISSQLATSYISAIQSSLQLYIILILCFVGLCLPVLIRIYFINRQLNNEKQRLLSIFLEVEESTVKRLIDRNNAFKMMVKYDRDIAGEENQNNEQMEEDSEEQEKCARKRVKDIQPVHYFYPFVAFFLVVCGIYSTNIYLELTYVNTLSVDLNQYAVYNRAHFTSMEVWLSVNYLVLLRRSSIRGQTDINGFLTNRITDVYNRQMDMRELYLNNLNQQMLSTTFSDFFVDFWVSNGCSYFTYQGCPTDYNTIFKQGGDQVWSLVVRKLDLLASNLQTAMANGSLPANYSTTFATSQPAVVLRNIMTYYYEDGLKVFNQYQTAEAIYQIQNILSNKTVLLAVLLGFMGIALLLYMTVLVHLMKKQTQRVERIVGFVPFRDLVTINEFKKYIRNKYETEIY